MSKTNYVAEANKILEQALQYKNSSNWKSVMEKHGTTLSKMNVSEVCKFPCYLVQSTINISKNDLVSKLWNIDDNKVKENDPSVMSWIEVEKGENWKVCSQYNKMSWPIWNRHTVFAQVKIEKDEKTTYLVAFSTCHSKAPPDPANFVTTQLHMSVFEYIDNGNGTTIVSRIALMDPSGKIPEFIVNAFCGNMIQMMNRWKKLYA
jgi:hypothetical protein